jgi:molybdopterin converting factor small subunit
MGTGLDYFPKGCLFYTNGISEEIMSDDFMITITVKFFATLREFGPKKVNIEIPTGSSIKVILERFKIPKEVKQLILLVNGIPHKNIDTILSDGDIVAIFPPIGGG